MTASANSLLEGLMEELAAIEHDRWAHWQRHLHSKASRTVDGGLVLPRELVERWERQISTPYHSLSEDEKESDREQVRLYLAVIERALKRP